MGVPKLHAWFKARYPISVEFFHRNNLPLAENLYIDLNDLLHTCVSRVSKKGRQSSLEQRIRRLFQELDLIISTLKPRKMIYIAVDGASPSAKLALQRSRRFATARREVRSVLMGLKQDENPETVSTQELEETEVIEDQDFIEDVEEDIADEEPEEEHINVDIPLSDIPSNTAFSSTWLTPGTKFMNELSQRIKQHILQKKSGASQRDFWWRVPEVFYSGPEVPGEGEHKILDYIRQFQKHPDLSISTTHCIFGSDADLILLGLASHVPNIINLRRATEKMPNSRQRYLFEGMFIDMLKECLIKELYVSRSNFKLDPEYIIDDLVLLFTALGNDFLPQIRSFNIESGAPNKILESYVYYIEHGTSHINPGGRVIYNNFRDYLALFPKTIHDHSTCLISQDLSTQINSLIESESQETLLIRDQLDFVHKQILATKAQEYNLRIIPQITLFNRSSASNSNFLESRNVNIAISISKNFKKSGLNSSNISKGSRPKSFKTSINSNSVNPNAEQYLEGLQWVMDYYFNGLSSWSWSYTKGSVTIRDILQTKIEKKSFNLGKPLNPYSFLLAILPPNNAKQLPEALQDLMQDDNSPLKNIYNLQTPGRVDADEIVAEVQKRYTHLSEEEKAFDRWGIPLKPTEKAGSWTMEPSNMEILAIDPKYFKNRELTYGFRNLLNVFSSAEADSVKPSSHGNSNVVQRISVLSPFLHLSLKDLSFKLIGRENILVNWPVQQQAYIVGISNQSQRFSWNGKRIISRPITNDERHQWNLRCQSIKENYLKQYNIQLGHIEVLLHYFPRQRSPCKQCGNPLEYVAPIQTLVSSPAPDRHPFSKKSQFQKEGCWVCKPILSKKPCNKE